MQMASYGADAATSLTRTLDSVNTYRARPKVLYRVPRMLSFHVLRSGTSIPVSFEAENTALTLKSDDLLLNGSVLKRLSLKRRASLMNFFLSVSEYPSPRITISTLSCGGPFSCRVATSNVDFFS